MWYEAEEEGVGEIGPASVCGPRSDQRVRLLPE